MKSKNRFARLVSISLLSLLFIGSIAGYTSTIRTAGPLFQPKSIFYFDCEARSVALTIDDGPDEVSTTKILDVLDKYDAKATFFLIGERIKSQPDIMQDILEDGHELGNHTWSESISILSDKSELKSGIEDTHFMLSPNQEIKWFRPGTGLYNDSVLEAVEPLNYKIVLGDVFPLDTIIPWSSFHSWYVTNMVRPGSIIVMHDAGTRGPRTAKSLELILPTLKQQGYSVVTLSKLEQDDECG